MSRLGLLGSLSILLCGCSGDAGATAPRQAVGPEEERIVRIDVEPAEGKLSALGESLPLTARAVWNTGRVAAADPVTWTSSNPEAVEVNAAGLATGIRNGTSVVSATVSGLTGTSRLTLQQLVAQVQVGVEGNPILPGEAIALSATAQDALGSPVAEHPAFQWASSNPLIATVDAVGVATGRVPGTVKISASANGVAGWADLQVASPQRPADTIFVDDFRSGGLALWEDGASPQLHRVVPDPTSPSSGNQVLEITYPQGADGGWLTRFFMPGYDSIHVRYRVRLDPSWQGATKLIALYGSRANDRWSGFGKSGVCPNGSDFFTTMVTMEDAPGNPPLRFYTYYPGMAREPDGVTCWGRYGDGSEAYVAPLTLVPGRWHEISFYVRLNDPGVPNGMQRFWLDGELRGEWTGIRFRDTDALRLNAVQLSANASRGAPRLQRVWVDEVVVTTLPAR